MLKYVATSYTKSRRLTWVNWQTILCITKKDGCDIFKGSIAVSD
jgi:hypothetical protein